MDVGCQHPRRGSNTFGLYKMGWSGILIDLEESKVVANKLARKRDKVILAAVSDKEELLNIYSDKKYSTNTTIKMPNNNDKMQIIGKIKTQTLSKILIQNCFPEKFELLCIDVEGADFEVLKGLNLNLYKPEIICIENWKADSGIDGVINSDIHNYLVIHGYVLIALSGFSTMVVSSSKCNIEFNRMKYRFPISLEIKRVFRQEEFSWALPVQ